MGSHSQKYENDERNAESGRNESGVKLKTMQQALDTRKGMGMEHQQYSVNTLSKRTKKRTYVISLKPYDD